MGEREVRFFREKSTGRVFRYDQMVRYCKENYDYGDETNYVTYMSNWYEEYGFEEVE